jgi:hypothetical protein
MHWMNARGDIWYSRSSGWNLKFPAWSLFVTIVLMEARRAPMIVVINPRVEKE